MAGAFVKLSWYAATLKSILKSCRIERPIKFKALAFENFLSMQCGLSKSVTKIICWWEPEH